MKNKMELRIITDKDTTNNSNLLDLPIMKTGELHELLTFGRKQNYKWKYSRNLLFQGYFYDPKTGNCLVIT